MVDLGVPITIILILFSGANLLVQVHSIFDKAVSNFIHQINVMSIFKCFRPEFQVFFVSHVFFFVWRISSVFLVTLVFSQPFDRIPGSEPSQTQSDESVLAGPTDHGTTGPEDVVSRTG